MIQMQPNSDSSIQYYRKCLFVVAKAAGLVEAEF